MENENRFYKVDSKVKKTLNLLKHLKNRKVIITTTVIIVVGLVAFFVYQSFFSAEKRNPIIAEVGDKEIRLNDFKERLYASTQKGTINNPVYINEEAQKQPLLDELVELEILDKYFAENNIEVSSDYVISTAENFGGQIYLEGDQKTKQAFENLVRLQLERDMFNSRVLGWKEGYLFLCMYDRAYQDDYDLTKPDVQEFLAKQKSYSKDYCEKLKTRLENGANVNKEIVMLENDKVIGAKIWSPNYMDFYFQFDQDNYGRGFGFPNNLDLFDQVAAMEGTEGKYVIVNANSITSDEPHGSAYAVVYTKLEHPGIVVQPYTSWLEEQQELLNVKTYIEKVKI